MELLKKIFHWILIVVGALYLIVCIMVFEIGRAHV